MSKRALDITEFLYNGLHEKVYKNNNIVVVNNIRRILDLQGIMNKVSMHGAPHVATTLWRGFKDSAIFFEQDVMVRIGADEMRLQYRDFIRRLEELSKEKGAMELTSLDILAKFLDEKQELYRYMFITFIYFLYTFTFIFFLYLYISIIHFHLNISIYIFPF